MEKVYIAHDECNQAWSGEDLGFTHLNIEKEFSTKEEALSVKGVKYVKSKDKYKTIKTQLNNNISWSKEYDINELVKQIELLSNESTHIQFSFDYDNFNKVYLKVDTYSYKVETEEERLERLKEKETYRNEIIQKNKELDLKEYSRIKEKYKLK